MNLVHEVNNYGQSLSAYIEGHKLPTDWFDHPDHIAVKAANAEHYQSLLGYIANRSQEIVESELDNRRIAVAFLAGPMAVSLEWEVSLVEIMEPRPEMVGRDKVGFDHMEFFQPYLGLVEEHLEHIAGIIPTFQRKPGHNTLSVTFGKQKEVKFTNRRLVDVIRDEKPVQAS